MTPQQARERLGELGYIPNASTAVSLDRLAAALGQSPRTMTHLLSALGYRIVDRGNNRIVLGLEAMFGGTIQLGQDERRLIEDASLGTAGAPRKPN